MLERVGIETEVQHHEVGTAGQAEIDMRFDTLLRMADKLMLYKYVTKCVAWAHDLSVTFMPKPLFQDNGSGMHCHQSLWKAGEPLFFSETGLRRAVRHGPLVHRGAAGPRPLDPRLRRPHDQLLQAAGPGLRGPRQPRVLPAQPVGGGAASRLYSKSPKAKRLEFRCPDPSANPYLAFSAMLMAGLDGVQNRTEPPDPVDKDLYDLPPEELAKVPQVPSSLEESLSALESDNDYLTAGGVFTTDLIDTWLAYKRIHEIDEVRLRPHPWEFMLYYDI